MTSNQYNRLLHWFAMATCFVAMLPIAVGALVTTMEAGMAFPDWPSSDGHGMLAYPWLRSAGDKFIEHGHRLAGMLIGVFAIVLTAITWLTDRRKLCRLLASIVLVGVILQGLLGGMRVLRNSEILALIHGQSAAWVFALIAILALVTGRRWNSSQRDSRTGVSPLLKPLAVVTPAVILVQYTLGGMVRHLGTALHEHLGFAAIATLFVIVLFVVSWRSGHDWLRFSAGCILLLTLVQVGLGVGAWVTRFGYAPVGYVAVQHSTTQIVTRTLHTIVGMMVVMTSVLHAIRVGRVAAGDVSFTEPMLPTGAVSARGGAA